MYVYICCVCADVVNKNAHEMAFHDTHAKAVNIAFFFNFAIVAFRIARCLDFYTGIVRDTRIVLNLLSRIIA